MGRYGDECLDCSGPTGSLDQYFCAVCLELRQREAIRKAWLKERNYTGIRFRPRQKYVHRRKNVNREEVMKVFERPFDCVHLDQWSELKETLEQVFDELEKYKRNKEALLQVIKDQNAKAEKDYEILVRYRRYVRYLFEVNEERLAKGDNDE